jgi:putative transcriptional regulator
MANKNEVNLKELREEIGVSQQEVASACKISRTYYGQIEKGERNPGGKLALRIADYYGINVRVFLED